MLYKERFENRLLDCFNPINKLSPVDHDSGYWTFHLDFALPACLLTSISPAVSNLILGRLHLNFMFTDIKKKLFINYYSKTSWLYFFANVNPDPVKTQKSELDLKQFKVDLWDDHHFLNPFLCF